MKKVQLGLLITLLLVGLFEVLFSRSNTLAQTLRDCVMRYQREYGISADEAIRQCREYGFEEINPRLSVPKVINSCESSEYGTFCGTWTWNGEYYDAVWDNGAKAQLKVERFDKNFVVFTRQDYSGVSLGLSARYQGKSNGNQIQNGTITGRWHWNTGRMQTKSWTWTSASW